MGKRAQRIPSWPGVIHSNKGRIHLRRPTCDILIFRLRRSGGPDIPRCPSLAHNATNTSHKRKRVERRRPDQRYLSGAPNGHARPVRRAAGQTRVQGVWVLLFPKRLANEAKWALLKAQSPSIGDLASEKYGANSPLHKIRSRMAGSTVPAGPTLNPPDSSQKKIRQFD